MNDMNGEDNAEIVYEGFRKQTMIAVSKGLIIVAPILGFLLFEYLILIIEAPFQIASAIAITLMGLLLVHILIRLPIRFERLLKSRHPYHLVSVFIQLDILALLYVPFCVRLALYEYPSEETLLYFVFIPFGLFLIFIFSFMGVMIASKFTGEFPSPYSINSGLPWHMDIGVKETDSYEDGYSDRPFAMDVEIPQPDRFHGFVKVLMHNLIILDYQVEQEAKLKLFLWPVNFLDRARALFMRNDSYVTLDLNQRTTTIHFPPSDYNILSAPISYHLLCANIVKRILRSYDYYLVGEGGEALDVSRHSWREVDKDPIPLQSSYQSKQK
jgi:hypothetical protein